MRLLSFLTDIEGGIVADDPSPDDGSWVLRRSANYVRGLARLDLFVQSPANPQPQPRGTIRLCAYGLADGSFCMRATLTWVGSDRTYVHDAFDKPNVSWKSEARMAAAQFLAGPEAESQAAGAADTANTEEIDYSALVQQATA